MIFESIFLHNYFIFIYLEYYRLAFNLIAMIDFIEGCLPR